MYSDFGIENSFVDFVETKTFFLKQEAGVNELKKKTKNLYTVFRSWVQSYPFIN